MYGLINRVTSLLTFLIKTILQAVKREGSLIKCLIAFKEDSYNGIANNDVDDAFSGGELAACLSAIEHWQIITLKDVRFSFNFKKACRYQNRLK